MEGRKAAANRSYFARQNAEKFQLLERVSPILVHIGYFSQRLRDDNFGQAVPSLEHARCGQGANDPGNDFTRKVIERADGGTEIRTKP